MSTLSSTASTDLESQDGHPIETPAGSSVASPVIGAQPEPQLAGEAIFIFPGQPGSIQTMTLGAPVSRVDGQELPRRLGSSEAALLNDGATGLIVHGREVNFDFDNDRTMVAVLGSSAEAKPDSLEPNRVVITGIKAGQMESMTVVTLDHGEGPPGIAHTFLATQASGPLAAPGILAPFTSLSTGDRPVSEALDRLMKKTG